MKKDIATSIIFLVTEHTFNGVLKAAQKYYLFPENILERAGLFLIRHAVSMKVGSFTAIQAKEVLDSIEKEFINVKDSGFTE